MAIGTYITPYGERRITENWMQVKDGNALAFRIMENHYSFNAVNRYNEFGEPKTKRFVGPGQRIVLIDRFYGEALFVWRKFIDDSGQQGVNCAAFRNCTSNLSSLLILEAEEWAFDKWGPTRVYTYVNPEAIKSKNPGYCFKMAGWTPCGRTKKQNLIILEKHIL